MARRWVEISVKANFQYAGFTEQTDEAIRQSFRDWAESASAQIGLKHADVKVDVKTAEPPVGAMQMMREVGKSGK